MSTANHSLLLETVRSLNLDVPIGWGLLKVAEKNSDFRRSRIEMELAKHIDPTCNITKIDNADATVIFPTLLGSKREHNKSILYPSTLVVDPMQLTQQLAVRATQAGVKFQYNTEVNGFVSTGTVAEGKAITGIKVTPVHVDVDVDTTKALTSTSTSSSESSSSSTSRVDPVDRVVIAAGMGTTALAATLHRRALAPIVPVKQVAFTVLDKTEGSIPVPGFFPSHPQTFFDTATHQPSILSKRGLEPFIPVGPAVPTHSPEELANAPAFAVKDLRKLPPVFPAAVHFPQQSLTMIPIAISADANTTTSTSTTSSSESAQQSGASSSSSSSSSSSTSSSASASSSSSWMSWLWSSSSSSSSSNSSTASSSTPSFSSLFASTSKSAYFDPSRFRVSVGNDFSNIDDTLPQPHVIDTLELLQSLIKLPCHLTDPVMDRLQDIDDVKSGRRVGPKPRNIEAEKIGQQAINRKTDGARHLSATEPRIACHVVSRDGLPLVGKSHVYNNLYFNTAHGTEPLSTAIAGGQICASVVLHDNDPAAPNSTTATTASPSQPIEVRTTGLLGLPLQPVADPSLCDPRRLPLRPQAPAPRV